MIPRHLLVRGAELRFRLWEQERLHEFIKAAHRPNEAVATANSGKHARPECQSARTGAETTGAYSGE